MSLIQKYFIHSNEVRNLNEVNAGLNVIFFKRVY